MIRSDSTYLFHRGGELTEFLQNVEMSAHREIEDMDPNYILTASETDLIDALVSKYEVSMPKLLEDQIHVLDQGETQVDVSQDSRRHIFDRDQPFYVKATSVTIAVPFEGDGRVFDYVPSTRTTMRPEGQVSHNRILFTYEQIEHDAGRLKQRYDSDLSQIKQYLGYAAGSVNGFNQSLQTKVRDMVGRRKEWLLSSQNMVSCLGIPINERLNVPKTYTMPDVRRTPKINLPEVPKDTFKPEPTLSSEDYEHILRVIHNMVSVMEKSPGAFANMKEEDLRSHFLVQLNGHFEGKATGETFNYEGN